MTCFSVNDILFIFCHLLSLSLPSSFFLTLSFHSSFFLTLSLSLYLTSYCLYISVNMCVCLSTCLYVRLHVRCPTVYFSILSPSLSLLPSQLCLSIFDCISLSLSLSLSLSSFLFLFRVSSFLNLSRVLYSLTLRVT